MNLGAFSVSLAVKDLETSRAFYGRLGFAPFVGDAAQGWLVLKNGYAVIGLFQGMFERNMLTFNPGWGQDTQPLDEFMDVRELQRKLEAEGLTLLSKVDEGTTGPGSFMLQDPDGNPVLISNEVRGGRATATRPETASFEAAHGEAA